MELKEIVLLYSNRLVKNDKFNIVECSMNRILDEIKKIGIPDIVLNKFEPIDIEVISGVLVFSKSRISEMYLGVEIATGHVICFSELIGSYSFMNTDYESFIKTNYVYEIFKTICVAAKVYGEYYDNTPSGGNFEKYSEVLNELILITDGKATREGIWFSLIQEMSMGVI